MSGNRASITDCGFAEMRVLADEVGPLTEMMKNRIRRLSHLEQNVPETFAEIARLSRLCYTLSGAVPGEGAVLRRLSLEDVKAVYVLPLSRGTERVLEALNMVRDTVRSSGPLDLDVSDQVMKSVFEVMES